MSVKSRFQESAKAAQERWEGIPADERPVAAVVVIIAFVLICLAIGGLMALIFHIVGEYWPILGAGYLIFFFREEIGSFLRSLKR